MSNEHLEKLNYVELKKFMTTQMMCPFSDENCKKVAQIIIDAIVKAEKQENISIDNS